MGIDYTRLPGSFGEATTSPVIHFCDYGLPITHSIT